MSFCDSSGTQVWTNDARFMFGLPSDISAVERSRRLTKQELVVQQLVHDLCVDTLRRHLVPGQLLLDLISRRVWDAVQVDAIRQPGFMCPPRATDRLPVCL